MNTSDLDFCHKVRQALDEQLERLPEPSATRLEQARKAALARRGKHPAGTGRLAALALPAGAYEWLGRTALAVPLLAFAFALSGVAEYQQQRNVEALAELDAAVLADELPLTAYLDEGFNAYLERPRQ